jgi:GTPase SAR1 family protein
MDTYSALKDEILQINHEVLALFSAAKSIPGMADYSFGEWEKTCEHLPGQLAEDTIRVAIVGAIKSGKSTFLNSIFNGDYVKRGAGVITSIVTRVRSGERLRAKLFFKSWDEINTEIEQALVLFPSLNWRSGNGRFDIRKEKDRHELQKALGELSVDQLITHNTRNINNVLLTCYLKGYDTVNGFLTPDNTVQMFEDEQFFEHKAFAGDESLAVYLKDILLEINSGGVRNNIEIADCQGSDSSNPLHLAMIQDYLLMTHMIIYVVSSRTGLREADIRFLSIIKKMGILDNIVFVVNCDFNEHESADELKSLVNRIREELSMIKQDPDIYSFSALFNLFRSHHDSLSDKDGLRLEQWKADGDLTELSDRETRRFESTFYDRLAHKRYVLLMKNHIERLAVILTGTGDWVSLNREVLAKDADSAAEILKKIKTHQQRFKQIKLAIKKTLGGAIPEIKKELHQEVHRFFDAQAGIIAKDIRNFIRAFSISPEKYQKSLETADFSQTLNSVFLEFKQSIDAHIAEAVNPEVLRFVQAGEKQIKQYFEGLIIPFSNMIEDAHQEFDGLLGRNESVSDKKGRSRSNTPQVDPIIESSELDPPPLVATMHYSTKIKTEAIMRLGFYRVFRNVTALFKKSAHRKGEDALKALQNSVQQMKRETEKSVVFHIKDYRENLKFRYLYKMVDATAVGFAQAVLDRFQAYFSNLSTAIERIGTSQQDKAKAMQVLNEMDRVLQELEARINRVRVETGQVA